MEAIQLELFRFERSFLTKISETDARAQWNIAFACNVEAQCRCSNAIRQSGFFILGSRLGVTIQKNRRDHLHNWMTKLVHGWMVKCVIRKSLRELKCLVTLKKYSTIDFLICNIFTLENNIFFQANKSAKLHFSSVISNGYDNSIDHSFAMCNLLF